VGSDPYEGAAAALYDLGTGGFDDDLSLYLGFAQRLRGPILELGCGSGRLLARLAGAGRTVVGVDRSAAMLAQARTRVAAETGVSLLQADMGSIPLAGRFDLIVVALDGFLHLTQTERQLASLGEAERLLARRGVLVLDLPGPAAPGWDDWAPGIRPMVTAWSLQGPDGSRVTKFSSFEADASTQSHSVGEIYEVAQCDGSVRRWYADYRLRFVFPAELELLLESSGLELLARYGDYDLGPFVAASPRQICVAGKRPSKRRR
jgi:SAM-dependent methyltransferase